MRDAPISDSDATVIHYCGLLFEQPSEPRYARLIGHVDLKRRDRDAPPVKHGKIGGFQRLHGTPGSVGDPIVGIASAVLARIDLRPLLPAAPLGGYHDAFDLLRRIIGKIDIDKHVARRTFSNDAASDIGRKVEASFPMRLAAAD
jgi:hypothetical protein